jgi:tetratricopeptide (TPR) repeat protein
MTYFKLEEFDQAEQYLLAAQRLDPAQFSEPQLFLADIYARRGNRSAAIQELQDLLAIRPDGPLSDSVRRNLAQLMQEPVFRP